MNYLDHFFLVGDTFEECKDAVTDTLFQFIPVQKIE